MRRLPHPVLKFAVSSVSRLEEKRCCAPVRVVSEYQRLLRCLASLFNACKQALSQHLWIWGGIWNAARQVSLVGSQCYLFLHQVSLHQIWGSLCLFLRAWRLEDSAGMQCVDRTEREETFWCIYLVASNLSWWLIYVDLYAVEKQPCWFFYLSCFFFFYLPVLCCILHRSILVLYVKAPQFLFSYVFSLHVFYATFISGVLSSVPTQ